MYEQINDTNRFDVMRRSMLSRTKYAAAKMKEHKQLKELADNAELRHYHAIREAEWRGRLSSYGYVRETFLK